jgi:hypothetical protein
MNDFALLRATRKNPVAKAVRTPMYRQRIVPLCKQYNRKKFNKMEMLRDFYS